MRHRVAGRHLGRDTAHRVSLYRNLVTDLLRYERITTTEAKAKEIRPMAEKIITLARRGDLHARRQAQRFVFDPAVVKKVFDEIGPRMKDRPGGYLRITGLEPRKGDGARMASIEFVDYVEAPPTPRPQRVTAAPARAGSAAVADAATAADVESTPDEEPVEDTRDVMDRMIDRSEAAEADVEADNGVATAEAPEADVEADDEVATAEAPESEVEAEAREEAAEASAEAEAEAAEAADAEAAEAQEAPERPEGQAPA